MRCAILNLYNMFRESKRMLIVLFMSAPFFLGSSLYGLHENEDALVSAAAWCWSSDDVGVGGYYRCVPPNKCKWIDGRRATGLADLCTGLPT